MIDIITQNCTINISQHISYNNHQMIRYQLIISWKINKWYHLMWSLSFLIISVLVHGHEMYPHKSNFLISFFNTQVSHMGSHASISSWSITQNLHWVIIHITQREKEWFGNFAQNECYVILIFFVIENEVIIAGLLNHA